MASFTLGLLSVLEEDLEEEEEVGPAASCFFILQQPRVHFTIVHVHSQYSHVISFFAVVAPCPVSTGTGATALQGSLQT